MPLRLRRQKQYMSLNQNVMPLAMFCMAFHADQHKHPPIRPQSPSTELRIRDYHNAAALVICWMIAKKLINCDSPSLSHSRDFFAAGRHYFPISANSRAAQFLK
jgi:hypothetical protein